VVLLYSVFTGTHLLNFDEFSRKNIHESTYSIHFSRFETRRDDVYDLYSSTVEGKRKDKGVPVLN
jgi:hypothetical protein